MQNMAKRTTEGHPQPGTNVHDRQSGCSRRRRQQQQNEGRGDKHTGEYALIGIKGHAKENCGSTHAWGMGVHASGTRRMEWEGKGNDTTGCFAARLRPLCVRTTPVSVYEGRDGLRARTLPVRAAWIELKRCSSSGFIEIFWPKPTLRAARRMNDTRFEYRLSWIDAARD